MKINSISTHVALIMSMFLLVGCKDTSDYSVEDNILQCFYDQYSSNSIDIRLSIDSAKQILLESDIIKEPTDDSFYNILVQIERHNELPFSANKELKSELDGIVYLPKIIQCKDSAYLLPILDKFDDSKFKLFSAVFDSISNKGNVSLSIIAAELLEVLEPEDFGHEFYNNIGIIMISNLLRSDFKPNLGLIPKEKPSNDIDYDTLEVFLSSKSILYISNDEVDETEARIKLKKFIVEKGEKHLINFNVSRDTKQSAFVNFLDVIEDVYKEVQNENPSIPYNFSLNEPE